MGKITVENLASDPSAPSAGWVTLYAKTSNNHLFIIDENGLVTDLSANTSASVELPSLKSTAGTLSVGTVVYQVGVSSGTATYEAARSDSASTMQAMGVVSAASTDSTAGTVVHDGLVSGVDTSSFSTGDLLYVSSASAGAMVATRPATPNIVQPIAVVVTAAVSGTIRVLSWGAYDLPNVATAALDMGGFNLTNAGLIEAKANANAAFVITDADSAVDNKSWYWTTTGATMSIGATSDNFGTSSPWVTVTRSGTVPTAITFAVPITANSTLLVKNGTTVADTTAPLSLQSTGANGATTDIYVGNRSPEGNVTADGGRLYARVNGTSSDLLLKTTDSSNTGWKSLKSFPEYSFDASDLVTSNTADWAVNGNAPVAADTNNSALRVRLMDSATEEGFGRTIDIPSGATNMLVHITARAENTPGGSVVAKTRLYEREIPNSGAPTTWSSAIALDDISLGANENWVVTTTTKTLATWGLTAGSRHQLQFTRTSTGNTLSGDLAVLRVRITFS